MPKVLRPIGHEDRLSIVDHLDELRSRLIVTGIMLAVAFGVCFWQNHALLTILNRALPENPTTSSNHISGLTADQVKEQKAWAEIAGAANALAASTSQSAADRARFSQLAQGAQAAAKALPKDTAKRLPITIGVGEPFTTTLTVSAYFALLFSLPLLLYEVYAFVIPALRPDERRIAIPVMLTAAPPVPRGRPVRLPGRAPARRPLPAGLQRPAVRHPRAGEDVLHVPDLHDAGHRPRLPAAVGAARAPAARARSTRRH